MQESCCIFRVLLLLEELQTHLVQIGPFLPREYILEGVHLCYSMYLPAGA